MELLNKEGANIKQRKTRLIAHAFGAGCGVRGVQIFKMVEIYSLLHGFP